MAGLHPVTGCSDFSAAPPAVTKIFNGNAVKGCQRRQQNASLWDKNNLAPSVFLFPGMNRDLKGPLTTFPLQISDVSSEGAALRSLHPVTGGSTLKATNVSHLHDYFK